MSATPAEHAEPPAAALVSATDDGVGAATVGTVLFAVALVVCLLRREALTARGDQWWIWACASGVLVGVAFRTFASRRARVYQAHAHDAAPAAGENLGPDGS